MTNPRSGENQCPTNEQTAAGHNKGSCRGPGVLSMQVCCCLIENVPIVDSL